MITVSDECDRCDFVVMSVIAVIIVITVSDECDRCDYSDHC